MFGYEEIGLNFSYPSIYLVIALLLLAAYSYYVYRFTIPIISKLKKFLLVSLRTLALLTIVIVFFEPIISFTKKIIHEPVNLIFIDNSNSINIEDRTNRPETIKNITAGLLSNELIGKSEFFLFGNNVRELDKDSLAKIDFTDGVTNLTEIFSTLDDDETNFASIVIISDGVYTVGSNPTYKVANLPVPVFTIGIGDTTRRNDVEVRKMLFNDVVYAETPTSIIAAIKNKGFDGETISVSLYENNQIIEEQSIVLSKSGVQNVSFNYIPKTSGEKKLSVLTTNLGDEFTYANNKKIFYVNVLSNKIGVMILAGSPSTDLSFIKNALKSDENLTVNSLTQISADKFVEDINYGLVDSADILFLVGFPGENTTGELLNIVQKNISDEKMPYFISLPPQSVFERINLLQDLPFSFNQQLIGYREVQPEILLTEKNNPLLKHERPEEINNWNNLPPVLQLSNNFTSKPGSKILSTIKVNNNPISIPLVVTRNFNGKKSVAVLAGDIWKWKLQTTRKKVNLFDSFILNCVKWLNTTEERDRISVKTSKRNYSTGEMIEFLARVSDESLNQVDDADIKLKISSSQNSYEVDMMNAGKGLYEGTLLLNESGDFNFEAEIFREGILLGKDDGTINVGEIEIELINPVMNYGLLKLLSDESGGNYYTPENYELLSNRLAEINNTASKEKIVTSDVTLWSDEWLLIITILLFSLEWFLRKRMGML
ncbi:MAG: hypothetical protein HKM87_01920 [Ignavibacteriaceae bacterium]|nr:hypothetical protein [Ignavibacteriaceae bacterium]